MFNVIDQLMFRPFRTLRDPAACPSRLPPDVQSRTREHQRPSFRTRGIRTSRRWTTCFSQSAAFVSATHGVGTGDATRERNVLGVTARFFEFFDARPAIGRFFIAGEDVIAGRRRTSPC